jgi:Transposase DDE domain
MAAFDLALSRVRCGEGDLPLPARVNQLALAGGQTFRQTTLTPGKTLRLFVQQVAHGNVACTAVRHLAGEDFSDSAWCQARGRLGIELIQSVHRAVVEDARRELNLADNLGDEAYRWRGHRVLGVDGTSDSMPDSPTLREHYGVPAGCRPGLGFPTSHLLVLMDHRSGLLIDCRDSPLNTSDLSQTPPMHCHLEEGDILLGDDAFSGWAHLALISREKLHAVMPVHHRRLVNFTPQRAHAHPRKGKSSKRSGKPRSALLKTLGKDDQLVEYFKPTEKPAWMDQQEWDSLPGSITVREIRRTVKRHGFRPITRTIVTTLLDPERYPADELVELRLTRWMIETNIRHLKITLGMDVLKCKSLAGVRKERLIFLLVYNLIRILMLKAARAQTVNVNRLSFADTLAWLRYGDLSSCPALVINPLRPGRLEPRAIKRQKKEFPYMTSPRAQLKEQLRAAYRDTA